MREEDSIYRAVIHLVILISSHFKNIIWIINSFFNAVFNPDAIGIAIFGNIDDEPNLIDSEKMFASILNFIDDAVALGKISKEYVIYSGEDHDKLDKDTRGPNGPFLKKLREWSRYCQQCTW